MSDQLAMPTEISVCGAVYKVVYVDSPSEADFYRRESVWGSVDFWTRTIKVFKGDRPVQDMWHTIIHEVLHAIVYSFHIKGDIASDKDSEDIIDLLAVGICDTFFRNGWIK